MSDSEEMPKRSLLDGYEPEIFKLVRDHATPEQWREWLRAPLEHAAAKGKTDLFTRLMDAGADGSAGWRGCHGRTLLIAAAQGKGDKMVRRLLTAGAKPEVNFLSEMENAYLYDEDTCGESALHVAANVGAEAVSRILLHAGADPNLPDSEEQTPLHMAARGGHHVVAGMLLLRGANLEARDTSSRTPLHLAAKEGHALCVSELLQVGVDHNARDDYGETPLMLAAQKDKVDTFEELVAAGAGLDARDERGLNVLDHAARHRSMGVVRSILRHGVDITATNDNGWTALHHAASCRFHWEDNSGTVRILLKAGADIEAKTTRGSITPLDLAVSTRETSCNTILALLEGGAAVNVRRAFGQTPLHGACNCSHADAVELLLRWGADETLTDEDGQTAGDVVDPWNESDSDDGGDEDSDFRQLRADDQRIRDMLARAPADRSWRRRGWLVLCRFRPDEVQLAVTSNRRRSSAKGARMSGSVVVRDRTGGDTAVDLARLVRNVVELDADAIFRLVVGFL